jgi:hypothetical protein
VGRDDAALFAAVRNRHVNQPVIGLSNIRQRVGGFRLVHTLPPVPTRRGARRGFPARERARANGAGSQILRHVHRGDVGRVVWSSLCVLPTHDKPAGDAEEKSLFPENH